MRQRQQQKASTRKEILGSATKILKTEGLQGASVADIMASAGLTVGGFYAHFASKDALADEVVGLALRQRREMFLRRFEGVEWGERIEAALRQYFTVEHRDDAANGCPLAMAAVETASNDALSSTFAQGLAEFGSAFQHGNASNGPAAPKEAALGTLALMVGGMILARATKGTPLSDEILSACSSYGASALESLARQATPFVSGEQPKDGK